MKTELEKRKGEIIFEFLFLNFNKRSYSNKNL